MAHLSTARSAGAFSDRLDSFFTSLGQGFNAYIERRSRSEEIRRLEAMTDAELAAIGISRDRILHHVFRDIFYL